MERHKSCLLEVTARYTCTIYHRYRIASNGKISLAYRVLYTKCIGTKYVI